ncbi:hypothetical protein EXS65_00195 [Candidatus Peribacteria bacterium]|nr:hypothetical protein [Candidatus Peribacteria bacterium]
MSGITLRIWLLEFYALALALIRMPGGVHTDEAKYLLSIPYPHPPILRSLFAMLREMPLQEFFIRFLIASALVQAVWLLVDIGYVLSHRRRIVLVLSWLLSSALVLQAGTVMMVSLTALFGLVCAWLALRPQPIRQTSAPLLACLWLFALFSVYQSVLYLPLLIGILRAAQTSYRRMLLFLALPLLLLAMYTLINPLILASMVNVSSQDAVLELGVRLSNVLWISLVAGSGIVTLAGIVGIALSKRIDFIATLFLLSGFIALTSQDYYAILLTPVLCAGVMLLLGKRKISGELFIPLHILSTAVFIFMAFPRTPITPARMTMRYLAEQNIQGFVLIDGPFGHEWQYESIGHSIRRFTQTLSSSIEASAAAIVCTKHTCEEDVSEDWMRMEGAPVEVWIKR